MARAIRRNPLGDPSFFCGCENCTLCFVWVDDQSVDDGLKVIAADLLGVPVEQVTPMQLETVREGLMAAHAAIRAQRQAAVEEYDEKQQVARIAIQAAAVIVSAVQAKVEVPKRVPTVVLDNVDLSPVIDGLEKERWQQEYEEKRRKRAEEKERIEAARREDEEREREMLAASPYSVTMSSFFSPPSIQLPNNWDFSEELKRKLERYAQEYARKERK